MPNPGITRGRPGPAGDLLLHIADLVAGGIIGVVVTSTKDQIVRTLRRPQVTPDLVDARRAARWAINALYNDVLPRTAVPVSEMVGPGHWSVTFHHQSYSYTASTPAASRNADVEVERESIAVGP
jgi:hypothetical protein